MAIGNTLVVCALGTTPGGAVLDSWRERAGWSGATWWPCVGWIRPPRRDRVQFELFLLIGCDSLWSFLLQLSPVWPFWTKVIWKITPLWTIFCPGKPRDHPRGRPCVPARPGIGIICPGIADAFKKMSSKLTTLETQYFEMGHLTPRHFL